MGKSSILRSPKREEEQEVPDTSHERIQNLDELEGFLGIIYGTNNIKEDDDEDARDYNIQEDQMLFMNWDFTNSNWEDEFLLSTDQERDHSCRVSNNSVVKREETGSCFEFRYEGLGVTEETKANLNLNLNYEEVLEAWSNRGSLSVHHPCSLSMSSTSYLGEMPIMDNDRMKRETSVLRYKEKRQNRLFTKKIRYEVRKFNADKRPRLKGRFVKRTQDKKSKAG